MNIEKVHRKNRKAISPVLATVILIAITLIAAIAIAGFVFGLFGSFTSSAQVQAQASLVRNAAGVTGTITATNTGSSNAAVNSVSLTYGGQTCSPTGLLPALPQTVTAGGAALVLTFPIVPAGCVASSTSGSAYSGSLSMSNGAVVAFTGSFS